MKKIAAEQAMANEAKKQAEKAKNELKKERDQAKHIKEQRSKEKAEIRILRADLL